MMDADELARLKALAEAATPGPWDFDLDYEDGHACVLGPDDTHLVTWQPMANCGVDAQFTAAARTAVPALLAEVERLRAAVREALTRVDATVAEYDEDDDRGKVAQYVSWQIAEPLRAVLARKVGP